MKRILVIGGVAAGLKAAAKARRCEVEADITVVEKGGTYFLRGLWHALLRGR